jgi:transaldolase
MPEKTLDAVIDHGVINGDTVTGRAAGAQEVFEKLAAVGIDVTDVFVPLEDGGVQKFAKSWRYLLEVSQGQLEAATK